MRVFLKRMIILAEILKNDRHHMHGTKARVTLTRFRVRQNWDPLQLKTVEGVCVYAFVEECTRKDSAMSSFVFNRASQMPDVVRTDPRIKKVIAAMNTFGRRPDSLIQILHAAQGLYGYLPLPIIRFIAQELKVPPSRVYGVVTFYHFFSLKPKGEHNCLICTGTACYVKGAQKLIDEVESVFGLKVGETTKDGKLSLQTARCIGACGLAPASTLDEEILAKQTPGDLVKALKAKLGVPA